MTRKQTLTAAVIFAVLLMLVFTITKPFSSMEQPQAEPLRLRLVTARSSSYPATRAASLFADMVFERTNGEIEIEIFSGSQAESDEQAIAEQVSFGAIDIACVSSAPLASYAPSMRLLELPMLFENKGHLHEVLDGEVGAAMLSSLADSQIVGMAFYDDGEKLIFNSLRQIYYPADMRDLRICCRQSEDAAALAGLWGAQPVRAALGDVYRLLQTGRANGADDNVVSYVNNRYYLEAPYLATTSLINAPSVLICSKMVFDTLTSQQQRILLSAAEDTVLYQREQYGLAEQWAWEFINNSSAIKSTILDRNAFKALSQPIYDECRLHWPIKLKMIEEMEPL